MFIPITVGIVNSRNNDDFRFALESIRRAFYHIEAIDIHVVDNFDKRLSIGAAFNEIADKANNEWVLYLGDDDFITNDYLISLAIGYTTFKEKNPDIEPVVISTKLTLLSETKRVAIDAVPQGMWKRDYVREHRFDETLERWVDTEFFERVMGMGDRILVLNHQYGYYYRQHDNNISGNKFEKKSKVWKEILNKQERNKQYGIES
jgi:glycosyltransferase involved in cell wall biosynthesis